MTRAASAPPRPTERRIEVTAPAKLNLGLRVVGRRDDGYHLLESLFVPLDLADDIVLSIDDGDAGAGVRLAVHGDAAVSGDGEPVPTDDSNLAVRAAHAFFEAAGFEAGIALRLEKRTPSGAGLGGGSSDAGAVLRALDRAWPGCVDPASLENMAVALGADVPFFLDPRPSFVSGIGEVREPLAFVPELHFVLANPRVGVSTVDVFRRRAGAGTAFAPRGQLERDLAGVAAEGWGSGSPGVWDALLGNDLAAAAGEICPTMAPLRESLVAAGALAAGQSGSGATVFGVFPARTAAEAACEQLSVNDSAWFRVAISAGAR